MTMGSWKRAEFKTNISPPLVLWGALRCFRGINQTLARRFLINLTREGEGGGVKQIFGVGGDFYSRDFW